MSIGIIGDSSCDLTTEMREQLGAQIAPLKITVGNEIFIDDDNLNLDAMLAVMRGAKTGAASACPSPKEFASLMKQHEESVVITLSSNLSGSYNAAMVGKQLLEEEYPNKKVHVFDSESASSGETQIALLVKDLENANMGFDEIVEKTKEYIANMHTLFVLEDLSNLIKNGRMSKVVGAVATALSIRPIMSDDGHGNISMLDKTRGTANALTKLVEYVAQFTAEAASKTVRLVLAHCNVPQRAQEVKEMLLTKCPALNEVLVVATKGLSSMYASEGGIILAF